MSESSRRFNFDEFDEQIAEALDELEDREELDHRMAQEDVDWEEEQAWAEHDRVFYPGQIGGVACQPTLTELPIRDHMHKPESPEAE